MDIIHIGSGGYKPNYATCDSTSDDYVCFFGGTSAAAPQVAGVAALVFSRRPDWIAEVPYLRRSYLNSVISNSAVDTFGPYSEDTWGYDEYYGYGLVNALRALPAVSRCDVDNSGEREPNIADLTYLVAYLFTGGTDPQPCELMADCDCSGSVNLPDLTFLVAFLFSGGPAPANLCFEY